MKIDLVNDNTNRTTISYARYLKSVELGYLIGPEYEVDHKDDDKTNDIVSNLQLLTPLQNRLKNVVYRDVVCEQCKNVFTLTLGEYDKRIAAGVSNMFCTHSCNGKYQSLKNDNLQKSISENSKLLIKQLRKEGLTGKQISLQTGFNRNTVMKYWI